MTKIPNVSDGAETRESGREQPSKTERERERPNPRSAVVMPLARASGQAKRNKVSSKVDGNNSQSIADLNRV
jgi:hypothetical protein